MSAVRSVEVVEALPFAQLGLEIHVAPVPEQLAELLPVRAVRSLYLAVELRCAALDEGMADAQILNVPMELRLELVAVGRCQF